MSLNDVKSAKLAALGYTGALNDAEYQFWLNYDPASGVTIDNISALEGTDSSRYVRILSGNGSWDTDGSMTVVTIPHGAASLPVYANTAATSANSTGTRFVAWDATNITVTYDVAPGPGTINLEWIVLVE